ncbi:hypothetical protein HOL63_03285 [Candidatus Peregrinibacteria bacterium]|jgi:hypothetical protein|nr:hypothetical protein [Candidatus Peregrinibacteria bacterium]MBT5468692.1 hypothetical protein [Candidatus Peregrinibacteria bacterium]MBT7337403.1 hypothetical protein [Candidatus Peregrinibacteria bacterium]
MLDFFLDHIVPIAHAQGALITSGIPGCDFATGNINPGECIPSFIAHVIKWVFGFAGSVCVIMIMFGGYEIVAGNLPGGSSESGKNRITWAIIGFILAATSFFIMDFIIAAIAG